MTKSGNLQLEKVLGVLAAMVVSGIFTFLVSVYILMDLGSRYHGSYEHYGRQYGVLTWTPVVIVFLAPAVLIGLIWLWKDRRYQ